MTHLLWRKSKNHLVLSLSKEKATAYHCSLVWTLWFAFSKRFSFHRQGYDLYEWNGALDQFSETCSDLVWRLSNLLHLCSSYFTSLDYLFLPGCELTFAASKCLLHQWHSRRSGSSLSFDNQLQVASFHTFFLLIYSIHLLWVRIKEWQEDRTEISYENRLLQWSPSALKQVA